MGPVTIAVDSYGRSPTTPSPSTSSPPSRRSEHQGRHPAQFGFTPNFENAKAYLEENDGAGNTFKATAKPVLIGTAVVGATTLIFSIIQLLTKMFGEPTSRRACPS